MQHKLCEFFKPYFAEILEEQRNEMHLTQKDFAERLGISRRYYYDLKEGNNMLSTTEFILLLNMGDDEMKLRIIHRIEALMDSEEFTTYVNRIDFI